MTDVLDMNSPIECGLMVWGSDPDIQRRDKCLCVSVMVHPSGHLVPSSCLLQHKHRHTPACIIQCL